METNTAQAVRLLGDVQTLLSELIPVIQGIEELLIEAEIAAQPPDLVA